MKNIHKRKDAKSRKALKKSATSSLRQNNKKELAEAVESADDVIDTVFWGEGCGCGCNGWFDDLEYMPIAEQTIGGKFLGILERIGIVDSWKKDSSVSSLYYHLSRDKNGIIATVHIRPDTATATKN